jgi:CheY-like chemotaxis protein
MIVVVDDDDDVREAVREILHGEGYQTVGASNGQEALELLQQTTPPPDLILLDLMMPVMDGWDFLSGIDAHPRLRAVPVALMSAHPSIRHALVRAREGYPEAERLLLPKPINVLRLLSTVHSVCERPIPH